MASPPINRWEDLRKKARQLENEIDLKLVSFSKLGTSYTHQDGSRDSSDKTPLLNSSSDRMFETMSIEIEQLLSKLTEVNDYMAEYASGLHTLGQSNAAQLHTLQRHRDILQDYSHEFTKTKANIQTYKDREDLLGSVQRDINAYKTGLNRRTDLYLKENEHIRNSDRFTDEAIGIALTTKENLQSQRGMLHGVTGRLTNVTPLRRSRIKMLSPSLIRRRIDVRNFKRFPGLNNLMQKINFRKRRDTIVLACVISLCSILLLMYALR